MRIIRFLKDWTLPTAMLAGILGYFLYAQLPLSGLCKVYVNLFISILQPILIFSMLFITFCKINPKELRWCRWHGILLLIQTGLFALLSLPLIFIPQIPGRVIIEGALLCLICPTATAAAVVTAKLGGNAASLTAYTIFINLTTALIVPLFVPLMHPHPEMNFWVSFGLIIGKVFPLLFGPFLLALFVRRFAPRLHCTVAGYKDLAFYLWAVALSLAIAVTVKSLMHSPVSVGSEIGIAAVSLACCVLQFAFGRWVGRRHGEPIGSAQALGQKNTVFAIWMGYTFLTPVTSVAGGFYSVWHNLYNSYQLYRMRTGAGRTTD